MQKIKKKCLRALARFNRSGLARKGMLAIAAVTVAAGDAMAASPRPRRKSARTRPLFPIL